MTKRPLLSINIPTYNRVSYLKQALDVLIPQLTDEVEINVSDNQSTEDDTWDYLGTLEGKVNRVKPPPGWNSSDNILSCLSLGTGDYTWIHCDDDIARLNAVENILRAIKDFDRPPALAIQWDGYDSKMTGFVNRRVMARWKRCDRNEFLRSISYKFTFASAVIIRRGCADVDYIRSHSPLKLIPGNIIFSTVGTHNDVVVSEDPLLAARGNPGYCEIMTTFSKEMFQLFRMNRGLGYDPSVLREVYSESLKTVMVHAALYFPVTWGGLWNTTVHSLGYKNFYTHVLPLFPRLLTPKPLANMLGSLRDFISLCWNTPKRKIGDFVHWLIWRIVRKVLTSVTSRHGEAFYTQVCQSLDDTANTSFHSEVAALGDHCEVRHPVYLRNPKYVRIGNGFVAEPGLRLEAWDSFGGERYRPVILIGNNVGLNWNVHIGAIHRIEIHDNVLIGSNVLITDHSHGQMVAEECDIPPCSRHLLSKGPVIIEENVWIGENVSILPNVTIGKGAVIGANSVVNKSVPAYAVMGGAPARVLKQLR